MSERIVDSVDPAEIGEEATSIGLDTLWRDWATINPSVVSDRAHGTGCVVDPEAIILASAALSDRERRLMDLVAWLATHGSGLLSVQRTRSLLKVIPGNAGGVGDFAHWAIHLGSDRRWQSLARVRTYAEPRLGKGPELPHLDQPGALVFRLRAGLGVGVKADILAFLLSIRGERRNVAELARVVRYTEKTVRLAAKELRWAGFIDETGDHAVRYHITPDAAERLVELLYGTAYQGLPRWCYSVQLYSFLLRVRQWSVDTKLRSSVYLVSSKARDLFAEFNWVFSDLGLRMPAPEPHPGPQYLPHFAVFIRQLRQWLLNSPPFFPVEPANSPN